MSADRHMHYFLLLSHDEQRAAIQRMAASGLSDYTIASATRLAVEMVRRILSEDTKPPPAERPACEICE
jgi:hypothetical protein